ncbi:UPF0223 family protein [Lacticaseibacillus zhaodongensis]|uniref:UPF0223 family protein n=1 Tax=Lacticaseibacillus zhaodongensis TaxID=2668065 RepID=UPI0012D2BDCE|nr:UPF0223 family protein [Lacticaseibacillus zhaodongensis]
MKPNYEYPIELEWTEAEKIAVVTFYQQVEEAYEHGVDKDNLLAAYAAFKEVVPDKGSERQYDRAFAEGSGYSTYQAVKAARSSSGRRVKLRP